MGDAIYVAVNEYAPESEKTLLWTLNSRKTLQFNKIFLLHVHTSSGLSQTLSRSLDKYRDICIKEGVNKERVDRLLIRGYDVAHVGEDIVKLINQNNIKKLVMGAAADPHYSRRMCITSRKAEYVLKHAPHSCKMWFICKGNLINTSNGSKPEPPQESKPETSEDRKMEIHYLKNMIGCVVVMVLVYMFLF